MHIVDSSGKLVCKLENINELVLHDVDETQYREMAETCYELCLGVIPTHSMPSTMLTAKVARQRGVRILYGGEGADEAFLGYPCYLNILEGENQSSDYSQISLFFAELANFDTTLDEWNSLLDRQSIFRNLSANERSVKLASLLDYFVQCRSVGFFASDIGVANFGIEGRSIFARRLVASVGLSSHPRVLLSGGIGKSILVDLYRAVLEVCQRQRLDLLVIQMKCTSS